MAVGTPVCDFGWKAPDFALHDLRGNVLSMADIAGPKGTAIVFICNHCPYVRAIEDHLARDAEELADLGIGVAAISANDTQAYPEDDPAGMVAQAKRAGFSFPYLFDEDQSTARAWGAVCTPDIFGFNGAGELQYRGRIVEATKAEVIPGARRDFYEAMKQISETGQGPEAQIASMGCSIKWKNDQ